MKRSVVNLSGKKVLLTGASGSIGRQIAVVLSKADAQVVLVGRNELALKETLEKMERPYIHSYIIQDLYDMDGVATLVERSVADGKKLDGFVHCGGMTWLMPLRLINYINVDAIMRVHFYAFIEIMKSFSDKCNCQCDASVVGISSIAASDGEPAQTIYAVSKAAMDAAVVTLSKELADQGIRVNSIRAGLMRTKMSDELLRIKGVSSTSALRNYQVLGLGESEDIANMTAFLLSSAAQFITGQHLVVDGGGRI